MQGAERSAGANREEEDAGCTHATFTNGVLDTRHSGIAARGTSRIQSWLDHLLSLSPGPGALSLMPHRHPLSTSQRAWTGRTVNAGTLQGPYCLTKTTVTFLREK